MHRLVHGAHKCVKFDGPRQLPKGMGGLLVALPLQISMHLDHIPEHVRTEDEKHGQAVAQSGFDPMPHHWKPQQP